MFGRTMFIACGVDSSCGNFNIVQSLLKTNVDVCFLFQYSSQNSNAIQCLSVTFIC